MTEINSSSETLSKVKLLSEKIKLNNISRNINENTQCLDEISNHIGTSISKNDSNKKYLSLILQSYQNKKKHIDYLTYTEEKKALIKRKCGEKYLSKGKKVLNYSDSEISSSNKHFEFLKEIIDDCSSLIKYYESQIGLGNYQPNVNNLKSFKTDESFFVYDFSNTTINKNPPTVLEKCISGVLQTKNECMKLLEISKALDFEKIKKLKEQIAILEEEYNKIYPKCSKLYEILVSAKIIKKDEESKKSRKK